MEEGKGDPGEGLYGIAYGAWQVSASADIHTAPVALREPRIITTPHSGPQA